MAMLYIRPLIVQALLWSAVVHGVFHRPQHVYSESSSLPSPGALPGGSPLTLCDDSRDTDLYSIDRVELYPKPLYM